MKRIIISYSQEELDFIQANCTLSRKDLTALFNSTFNRNLSKSNISGLCKRKRWLTGRDGRFKKGNIPSPLCRPRGPNAGSFKKGNTPANHLPVGSEVVRTKDKLLQVKVAEPNVWRLKHRLVWEQANGPVPEGMLILFVDGNNQNCDINNLKLVSRREHLALNQREYKHVDSSIKPSVLLTAKLDVKVREMQEAQE